MRNGRQLGRMVIALTLGLIVFFPVFWLVVSALQPITEVYRNPFRWLPDRVYWGNFQQILGNERFWGYFTNSVVVGGSATAITVVLSVLGGYGLARFRFPGANTLANVVLFVYMVPKVLLAVPIYVWMFNLGLLDTHAGLIIAHVGEGLPFALWMLRGYFASLPRELEDSARIDGSSWMGALVRVILPISGPGIVVVAMYTLITSWNDYLFAFMLVNSGRLQTLPVGLTVLFESADSIAWGPIMAGAIITTAPVLLLFVLLQRFLVGGLTAGAVKG